MKGKISIVFEMNYACLCGGHVPAIFYHEVDAIQFKEKQETLGKAIRIIELDKENPNE